MIQQIQQAVDIANSSTADHALKKQALDFLEEAKASGSSAQVFASLLQDPASTDISRFVALQVLSDLVLGSNEEQLSFLKKSCVDLLRSKSAPDNKQDPEYVRNKVAELASRLFYCMYGECNSNLWPNFFQDLIQLLNIEGLQAGTSADFSATGLDLLLKIVLAINSEIADQTFVRSKEIQSKNNELKDAMRLRDVQLLSSLWFNTLKLFQLQQHPAQLANLTLSCIGSYISWIEINLIVNPEYINVIFEFLDQPTSKIACAQCLCEIISKKMKPGDKLSLLSMLNLTEKVICIGNDDLDVQEQLAKLVSSVGLELSIILEQCNDESSGSQYQDIATAADSLIIHQVSPLVLKFMEHEYDSVTQQCFPFVSHYLQFLKKFFALGGKPGSAVAMNSKRLSLDSDHENFLNCLMNACMKKMLIDETCDEDCTDEIDEFNDTIRSKLKIFQDSIAIINPGLYLRNVAENVENLISSTDWRQLEFAIYQMHNLAESIRNNLFGVSKKDIFSSEPHNVMCRFMATLLDNTNIFLIQNSLIQISFFELVVRHHLFLQASAKDEITLLNIFCSEFGMFNSKERVRLRTWYLFTRFIKATKPKLSADALSQLLTKVSQLLIIKPIDLPPQGVEIDATFDNQLYLFDGVGMLIGSSSDSTYSLLDGVLVPLFSDLESCISIQIKSPKVVLQTHHILMAIGTVARGIHSGLVPENQVNNLEVTSKFFPRSVVEKFSNVAEVLLVTFSYFNKHEVIRDATRFSFARLIPILNEEILPFASRLIAIFLSSDLKILELNDFLGFLGQIVHTFHKSDVCYQLLNNLLTPVIEKVFKSLAQSDSDPDFLQTSVSATAATKNANEKNVVITDSFRDRVILKKAYYTFLQSFITNNSTSLFLTESNRSVLPLVLEDLLTYTPDEIHETSSMKLSLNVLINFVRFLGTGICTDTQDPNAIQFGKLEGLGEFFISKVIPLVFEVPFKPEYGFNVRDGSCRVLACDLSRLLKALHGVYAESNPNPCVNYLTDNYFPQVQFPDQLSLEFVNALVNSNDKSFEKYFVNFITNVVG
ncbi:LANO_0F15632g1_1 [Lachancea nothofagi CBS 11611]|uniref:Exportin-T n=1 Tax=Lachancea nothofagi CBS 11611 TaxID=1266666 RepID=A0A1G4KCL5_9SACH|nr:LANO_0F15632g1_1 [Lachancea nothofagi CBS 11611]